MKIFLKIFVFEHSSFCLNSQFRIPHYEPRRAQRGSTELIMHYELCIIN